jgi:hypothetical protein
MDADYYWPIAGRCRISARACNRFESTLLYFAAASFTEAALRLGRPNLAGAFLMHDHPHFGPQSRVCLERVRRDLTPEQRGELIEQIGSVIEPFDVAGLHARGLDHRGRRNFLA